jgi:hypothetical protein
MGLFARIFGSDVAIKETIATVRDGLDALVYTDEERAQQAATDRAAARGMVVEWMESTSGQNLARRWLSIVITTVWLGQYLAAQAFVVASIWVTDGTEVKIAKVARAMAEYAENMNGAVMLILGFYFAAPHLDKIVDGAMAKFGKKIET